MKVIHAKASAEVPGQRRPPGSQSSAKGSSRPGAGTCASDRADPLPLKHSGSQQPFTRVFPPGSAGTRPEEHGAGCAGARAAPGDAGRADTRAEECS